VIVLDTNVLSEGLKPTPSAAVMDWMCGEPLESAFTTSISEGELLFGIALLPDGRRRGALEVAVTRLFSERFAGRVLPFDSAAAREFAEIAAGRRRIGKPISEPDARIAAITRSRRAVLATRNVSDFIDCGIELIDPWV
jgi:toxin FitB